MSEIIQQFEVILPLPDSVMHFVIKNTHRNGLNTHNVLYIGVVGKCKEKKVSKSKVKEIVGGSGG